MTSVAAPLPLPTRRSLQHAFDVLAVLVARDLKLLYKRSSLGFGWALVTPLLQVCIFVLVFRRVLGAPIENYASFVFTGVLVWGWFHASVGQSTSLITSNRALVRQPGFPLSLLPLVTVAVRLFHFSLALPFLFGLLWFQGIRPTPSWSCLPLLVLVQFILTAAFAYPLAALNVRLRDTHHVTTVLLQLAMYLTPIFYSLHSVPPALSQWLQLNPIVVLLDGWRDVIMRGLWPDTSRLVIVALMSSVALIVGQRIFVQHSRRFVEEL